MTALHEGSRERRPAARPLVAVIVLLAATLGVAAAVARWSSPRLSSQQVEDLVAGLAAFQFIGSESECMGGESRPSHAYKAYYLLCDEASPDDMERLLEHRSPTVRVFAARYHLERGKNVERIAALMRDDTRCGDDAYALTVAEEILKLSHLLYLNPRPGEPDRAGRLRAHRRFLRLVAADAEVAASVRASARDDIHDIDLYALREALW